MKASAAVVYYAGAVAIMFLMFASLQGAMQIIDERRSGVMDRLLAGSSRRSALLAGKFAFLVVQGFLQVSLIFAAASLLYDVNLGDRWPMWVAISLAAFRCRRRCRPSSERGLLDAGAGPNAIDVPDPHSVCDRR